MIDRITARGKDAVILDYASLTYIARALFISFKISVFLEDLDLSHLFNL